MKVVNYDYIQEISTADALKNAVSDVTTGYNGEIPGVNTYKINAETSIYNEQGGGTGIAGWATDIDWGSYDSNTVAWSSGNIYLPDGTTYAVSSGGTGDMSTTTYIYYDMENNTVGLTTSASDSVGEDKILLCVANPVSGVGTGKKAEFQAFGTDKQSTIIYAGQIAANTITGNEIAANSIKANQIDSGAITTDKIAAGAVDTTQLADYSVVADKMYVSQLSAIAADLGSITAGSITGVTITASDGSTSIVLNPSNGEIQIKRGSTVVGRIKGGYESTVGNYMGLIGTNTAVDGTLWCLGKLRIPVGNNLYN